MQPATTVSEFRSPEESIGELDLKMTARLIAASADVALIVDSDGLVRDVGGIGTGTPLDDSDKIVEQAWADSVTVESQPKVAEMLRDAKETGELKWREINYPTPGGSKPYRFIALPLGSNDNVIALGRDLTSVSDLQQRLLHAQQAMEREYSTLREAEGRYRLLFHLASEAVLVVEQSSGKVIEANPAAGNVTSLNPDNLMGQSIETIAHTDYRDPLKKLVKNAIGSGPSILERVRLANTAGEFRIVASAFRQNDNSHVLVHITSTQTNQISDKAASAKLFRVLNRIPDAFVVTDEEYNILETNLAFLELSQLADADAAKGQPLGQFIGRRDGDLAVLKSTLREHGWVRNFETVFKSTYGIRDDIEISAVDVNEGLERYTGFVIRAVRRSDPARATTQTAIPADKDRLTDLVGRSSLREIVQETTEVIERLCIETALNLSKNNRALAAEMLGVSRQSLYVKLNRYGLGGNLSSATDLV